MLKNATTKRRTIATATLAIALLGATAAANADHNKRFRGKRDADVDVKAKLNFHRGAAQLNVKIEAEIEGRFLNDRYNVVLTIAPSQRGFGARFVRPQQVIVPLNPPKDIDDDEIEFEQRATILLPINLARFGNSLVVRADLVSVTTGRTLDRDTSFVSNELRPIPQRPRHRGHRFGRRIIG